MPRIRDLEMKRLSDRIYELSSSTAKKTLPRGETMLGIKVIRSRPMISTSRDYYFYWNRTWWVHYPNNEGGLKLSKRPKNFPELFELLYGDLDA
jgi:hypothetical protein